MIVCEQCGIGAEKGDLFQEFGFVLSVECPECGTRIKTSLSATDLPRRELIGRQAVGELIEEHPGVEIDENTPLWAIKPFSEYANPTQTFKDEK